MRIYSVDDEEKLRILRLVKDWSGEGFLSEDQRLRMEADMACGLRRTNGFLRLVLFVFTLIAAGALVGLFFLAFQPSGSRDPWFLMLVAALGCYIAAEAAVQNGGLYRYGIEEGLALLAIAFLFFGLMLGVQEQHGSESVAPVAGAVVSLLIYCRFGFRFAFVASMLFAAGTPEFWTDSRAGQHVVIALLFAAGLIAVMQTRDAHRADYIDEEYSFVEGILWLGIYITVNLHLSSPDMLLAWWSVATKSSEFSGVFYWSTYALIWCLPAAMLWRGLTRKDRIVIWVGLLTAILTLVTNKPYLGWERHPWDPMLLGIVLTGGAIAIRRWLAQGTGGVRNRFTAKRLSSRDQRLKDTLSAIAGFTTVPSGQTHNTTTFGGGSSGGGGASSDF